MLTSHILSSFLDVFYTPPFGYNAEITSSALLYGSEADKFYFLLVVSLKREDCLLFSVRATIESVKNILVLGHISMFLASTLY